MTFDHYLSPIVLNHLKHLNGIQSSPIESSTEELNSIIESIRSHQNYYVKLTEGYINKNESLNSVIASKLTKLKVLLLKSKNEKRLFISTGKLKHKNNFADYLQRAIEEMKELHGVFE